MNQAQIDFQQLRIKHILYKSKVRSVLYGGTHDAAFFSQLDPISLWFRTVGNERYSQEPELHELLRVHQELGQAADVVFSLYKSGRIDQAHEGLESIDAKSEQFLSLLSKLEDRLAEKV